MTYSSSSQLALLSLFLTALAWSVSCGNAETTTEDDTSSTNGSTNGVGGTPSVASSTTTVGVGGSGGMQSIQCLQPYTDVPTGECDLLLQGCPAGTACEPVSMGATWTTQCVPNTGLKGPGDPCVNSDSCRAGLHCVFGRCSPVCCPGTHEPCGVNGVCNVDSPFGQYEARVCSYLASCSLFSGECDEGSNCYPLLDDGISVCAPIQGTPVGEGQSCGSINDCEDSMVCNGVCRWACYLDGDGLAPGAGGCPAGQTCGQSGANPPQNIGVCG